MYPFVYLFGDTSRGAGLLYRSNKLTYDRGINTLWHQFRREPVIGSVHYEFRQRPYTVVPVSERSGLPPTKAPVLGLTFGGRRRAYPLELLRLPGHTS